jgi:hypothetical protein
MPFPTEVVFTSARNRTCSGAADDATSSRKKLVFLLAVNPTSASYSQQGDEGLN